MLSPLHIQQVWFSQPLRMCPSRARQPPLRHYLCRTPLLVGHFLLDFLDFAPCGSHFLKSQRSARHLAIITACMMGDKTGNAGCAHLPRTSQSFPPGGVGDDHVRWTLRRPGCAASVAEPDEVRDSCCVCVPEGAHHGKRCVSGCSWMHHWHKLQPCQACALGNTPHRSARPTAPW